MSFKATKPGNAAPDIKISSPMKNSSTDNETSIISYSKRDTNNDDKDVISNIELVELDENLKSTNRSLEEFVHSPMFNRLYSAMLNINSTQRIVEISDNDLNRTITDLDVDDEDESDDSYAAKFGNCIRRITVYLSSQPESKASHGGLFRFVSFRNKTSLHTCLYTAKLKNIDSREEICGGTQIGPNEFWFWWINDDEEDCENNLETNDQILAINGILLETGAAIEFALDYLNRIRRERAAKKPFKVQILIARDISRHLVHKNLKKPHLVLDKFVRAASSSSLSSIASLASQTQQTQPQPQPITKKSFTQEPAQLIYCLNDGSLRIVGGLFKQDDVYDNKESSLTQKPYQEKRQQQQQQQQHKEEEDLQSNITKNKSIMVLNTEWTQLETIELLCEASGGAAAAAAAASSGSAANTATATTTSPNAPQSNANRLAISSGITASPSGGSLSGGGGSGGGGFGFGITGNKSTGVVVKALTPGGYAQRDGRLRINDQIFQIGEINVRNMSSEQVAAVLRQSSMQGQMVKFIVARPIHNPVGEIELAGSSAVERIEFDANNKPIITNLKSPNSQIVVVKTSEVLTDKKLNLLQYIESESVKPAAAEEEKIEQQTIEKEKSPSPPKEEAKTEMIVDKLDENQLSFEIHLNNQTDASLLDILNSNLSAFSLAVFNEENSSYLYVNKIEDSNELVSKLELYDILIEINGIPIDKIESKTLVGKIRLKFYNDFNFKLKYLKQKWNLLIEKEKESQNEEYRNVSLEIIASRIDKTSSKSLGITLEGTVDIDDHGNETYPHHYIRSVMQNGPVDSALDTKFRSGDELLEIDFVKLYAINYMELLDILKGLKNKLIYMVCVRKSPAAFAESQFVDGVGKIGKRAKSEGFLVEATTTNGNVEQEKVEKSSPIEQNFSISMKKSSTSNENIIITTTTNGHGPTTTTNGLNGISTTSKSFPTTKSTPALCSENLLKNNEGIIEKQKRHKSAMGTKQTHQQSLCMRSRSLELNGLALWNKRVVYINLCKNEKGLGFSLIDYQQDPFNPLSKTMIVIRALVPNGVAQLDGRLMPGQRLVSVDDVVLDEDLLGAATNGEKEKSNSSLNQHLYHSTGSISKLSTAPVPVVDLLKYTVNLLKSIPVGKTVRLGVQKPLPYPDAIDAGPFGDEQSQQTQPNQRESSEEREQISRKQGNFKAASKSYHSLYHTKTVSSSNFSPVAKKRKQIRTKLTKKKVITTSHYDLKQSDEELASKKSKEEEVKLLEIEVDQDEEAFEIEDEYEDGEMNDDEYGIVATSAPAILDQDFDKPQHESTYSFYSSTSMLKLNTFNLVSKINMSSSRVNSNNELAAISPSRQPKKSSAQHSTAQLDVLEQPPDEVKQPPPVVIVKHKLKFKDQQTNEEQLASTGEEYSQSATTPKSKIKSCIKPSTASSGLINKSASMPFKVKKEAEIDITKTSLTSEALAELQTQNEIIEDQSMYLLLEKEEEPSINENKLAKKMIKSSTYLNYLLSNEPLNSTKPSEFEQIDNEIEMDNYVRLPINLEIETTSFQQPPQTTDYTNKQLITEEQFNQAFIQNTNKKLINLIETTTTTKSQSQLIGEETEISQYEKTQKRRKEYFAKFDKDDDISTARKSKSSGANKHASRLEEDVKRTKKSKSSYRLPKDDELHEMVKDMASFKWPDLSKETNQTNEIVCSSEIVNTKQITFKDSAIQQQQQQQPIVEKVEIKPTKMDSKPTKRSTKTSSKSRSPTRSYSGGIHDRFRSETRTLKSNTISFMSSRAASTSTGVSRSSSRSGSVKIVNILGKEIVRLPSSLEREIKIKKKFDPLGIAKVDCSIDEGMNGCCVLKIEPNSACARDGRLKCGDYLLSVNNEQMRHLSNSSARAILTRASLISNDVVILYIPREEALKYKESFKTPGVEMNPEETSSRQLMEISDKQDNDVHIQKPSSCQHLVSIPIMNQSMSHDQITAAGSKHTKPSTAIMLNLSASLSTSTTTALNRPFHSSCSLSSSRSTSSLSSSSSLSRRSSSLSNSSGSTRSLSCSTCSPSSSSSLSRSCSTSSSSSSSIKSPVSCSTSNLECSESRRSRHLDKASSNLPHPKSVTDIALSSAANESHPKIATTTTINQNKETNDDEKSEKNSNKHVENSKEWISSKGEKEIIRKEKQHHRHSCCHSHKYHHHHHHHRRQQRSHCHCQQCKCKRTSESKSRRHNHHYSHHRHRNREEKDAKSEVILADSSLEQSQSQKYHHSKHKRHHHHHHHNHRDKRKQHSSKKGEKSSHESPIKHHSHHRHHHHNQTHHHHDRKRQKPLVNEPLTSNDNNQQEDHHKTTVEANLVQRYYNNQNQLIETSFVPHSTHLSSMSSKFNQTGVSSSSSNDITSSLWGPPRVVVLQREPNKSLGISIVGGKLDVCSSSNSNSSGGTGNHGAITPSAAASNVGKQVSSFISGIFIKHVLDNSPAGVNGTLKTGDRILAVNDIDLTQATHDRAVDVIRNAKSPVKFLIQSLIYISTYTPTCDEDVLANDTNRTAVSQDTCLQNPKEDIENINSGQSDPNKQIIDEPNQYNYSLETLKEKYNYLLPEPPSTNLTDTTNREKPSESDEQSNNRSRLFIFRLKRKHPNESLGLSLSGNVNLNKTSVFVCAIYKNSIAHKHGLIKVGDQILEINGQVIYGRAHSNVTPLIRNMKDLDVYLVILRSAENLNQMYKPTYQQIISRSGSSSPSTCNMSPIDLSSTTTTNNTHQSSLSIQAPLALSTNTTQSLVKEDSLLTASNVKPTPSSEQQSTDVAPLQSSPASRIIRKITLKKGPTGFGIAISEDRYNRLIVRGLNPNGVAFQDGRMQVGDEILAVNEQHVSKMKYDEVMGILHTTSEPVEFQVSKAEAFTTTTTTASSSVPSACASSEPSRVGSPSIGKHTHFATEDNSKAKDDNLVSDTLQDNAAKNASQETKKTQDHEKSQHEGSSTSKMSLELSPKRPQTELVDSRTAQIRVGEETLIEIERGKMGLGLSIVGGSDTQLPGIIIHDIYQNGAAFRDRRLAIGDQILRVNEIDLCEATHEQALNALRQTSENVRLLVHRGFHPTVTQKGDVSSGGSGSQLNEINSPHTYSMLVDDEHYLNVFTVELNKKFAKGLGFSIIGRRDGSGVFISHIIDGGCAQKDGRLMIGDLILEVNNQDIRKAAYNDVAFLLKTLAPGKISLKIGRFKTSASQSQTSSGTGSKTASRRNSTTQQQSSTIQTVQSTTQLIVDPAKQSTTPTTILKSTVFKK